MHGGVSAPSLLQCMKVKSESEVAQSCLILRNPVDCSLPGSSVRGIFHRGEAKDSALLSSRDAGLLDPDPHHWAAAPPKHPGWKFILVLSEQENKMKGDAF